MEAQIKLGRIFGIEIGQRHEAPEQIRTVGPDSSVVEALQRMGREGVNQLPGRFWRAVGRNDLTRPRTAAPSDACAPEYVVSLRFSEETK